MERLRTPSSKFMCQRILWRAYSVAYNEYIIEAGGKVLEVGCGEHPIKGVSHPTDANGTGNPDVMFANVLNLPFQDNEFDLVIARNFVGCFDCMGRPDLKQQAVAEMERVGKVVFVREYNRRLCSYYWLEKLKRLIIGKICGQ